MKLKELLAEKLTDHAKRALAEMIVDGAIRVDWKGDLCSSIGPRFYEIESAISTKGSGYCKQCGDRPICLKDSCSESIAVHLDELDIMCTAVEYEDNVLRVLAQIQNGNADMIELDDC